MKRMIVAMMLVVAVGVGAQNDTTIWRNVVPTTVGATMVGAGCMFTFNKQWKEVAVTLRDNVVDMGGAKMHFDDYIQYVPAIAPVALNVAGVKGKHSLRRLAVLEGGSYLLGGGWLNAGKYRLGVMRPDGSTNNSFPSGHSFMAFAGAEVLRREYGEEHPWMAIVGYAVAVAVGAMRIYNNRHWAGDVLAGAGLGIMSVSIVYWLFD